PQAFQASPYILLSFSIVCFFFFFFFIDPATTEIYTLSLHDALPIYRRAGGRAFPAVRRWCRAWPARFRTGTSRCTPRDVPVRNRDRKSTRLNSSHVEISYAVFCLKKKKNQTSDEHTITNSNTCTATP